MALRMAPHQAREDVHQGVGAGRDCLRDGTAPRGGHRIIYPSELAGGDRPGPVACFRHVGNGTMSTVIRRLCDDPAAQATIPPAERQAAIPPGSEHVAWCRDAARCGGKVLWRYRFTGSGTPSMGSSAFTPSRLASVGARSTVRTNCGCLPAVTPAPAKMSGTCES